MKIKEKYDRHLERVHEESQQVATVSGKQLKFSVDYDSPVIDWSSSWLQPMQVPFYSRHALECATPEDVESVTAVDSADEKLLRQVRAGSLPGEPVTRVDIVRKNDGPPKHAQSTLAAVSSHMHGVIPAIPSTATMHWDTTFSGEAAGAFFRNVELGAKIAC